MVRAPDCEAGGRGLEYHYRQEQSQCSLNYNDKSVELFKLIFNMKETLLLAEKMTKTLSIAGVVGHFKLFRIFSLIIFFKLNVILHGELVNSDCVLFSDILLS